MNVVGAASAIVIPMLAAVVSVLAWGRELAGGFVVFITLLLAASILAAVHHGEVVAHRLREPYASLVLALVVTVIEVALIVTLTVAIPQGAETLARDTVFAAVMIACNGILGISLLFGARRTREVGVRIALGARPSDVRWLVMRQGLGFTLAGIAIGLLVAAAVMRALRSQLYEVSTSDPLTFAAVAAILLMVATAATYVPARRATRLDPVKALRSE